MPKYRPSAEEEELYGVKPPGKPDAHDMSMHGGQMHEGEKPEEEGKPESVDEEMASSQHSAIVPNNILMGKDGSMPKEGDEVVLKVIKVYGDEAEVQYSNTPPSKIGASDYGPGGSADEEIEAMDEKGSY